jgi:tetratricopeptide (TPR) repeat protein
MEKATDNARSDMNEALAELRAGRLESAEALGRRLLKAAPSDPAVHLFVAAVAFQRAHYADAIRWARSCLALSPETMPAMMIAGRAAGAAGDLIQAMEWFRRACKISPDRPEPAFLLCVTQLQCGDPAATSTLEHILRSFPNNADGWSEIGVALRKENQLEAAAVAFARAASASPGASHSASHGSVLLALGRHREAIAAFRKALAAAPDSIEVLLLLAQCLRQIGKPKEAREILERIVELKPDSGHVFYTLGLVCDDLHDLPAAIAAYRQCVNIQPDLPEAHVNLGLALQQMGELETALQSYRIAIRLRSDTFGRISQALCSSSKGQLWLDLNRLRRSLSA